MTLRTMPSESASVQLTERFQARLANIGQRASRLTAAEWDALGSWNEVDITRFAERVNPALTAARQATANASAGYYSLITDTTPTGFVATVVPDLRSPFTAYWHGLAESRPWIEALEAGRARAESVAVDLVTATTREVAAASAGTDVVGWRRVLTGNSCTWCGQIASQRYRTVDSATFGHDNCDCIVVPIYGDSDPGQVINARIVNEISADVPLIRV